MSTGFSIFHRLVWTRSFGSGVAMTFSQKRRLTTPEVRRFSTAIKPGAPSAVPCSKQPHLAHHPRQPTHAHYSLHQSLELRRAGHSFRQVWTVVSTKAHTFTRMNRSPAIGACAYIAQTPAPLDTTPVPLQVERLTP